MILHTQNGLAVSSTNFRGDNLTFTPPSLPPPPLSLSFPSGVLAEEQAEEAVDSDGKWCGEGLPESAGRSVWILQRRSQI